MKGIRVQSVVHELKGEKIDIIPWHGDSAKFVCNALSPAEISRVVIDEANRSMEVIVPDEYLSVAIGRRGQNVRLASKLTGWSIDVKSETDYSEAMRSGYDSLIGLPGVGSSTADALYEQGFYSIEELANASVEELIQIKGISEKKAQTLLESARQTLEMMDENDYMKEDNDISEAMAVQNSPEDAADGAEDPGDTTAPEE
jgi:N utilization substance protein A